MIFGVARRLGLLDPVRVAASGAGLLRWGATLGAATAAAALRHPRRAAVIDHRGELSYLQLDRRSSALAAGLADLGLEPGHHLGILCLNHRDFVEASVAAAKASLVPVMLNTGFAIPQLDAVLSRESVAALVSDERFGPVVEATGFVGPVVTSDGVGDLTLHDLRHRRRFAAPHRPRMLAPVLLTSGTTGTPKGARREAAIDMAAAVGILDRLPVRSGDVFVIAPPLFHAWGLAHLTMAISLASTVVLSPTFDPAQTVAMVIDNDATVLVVVPAMIQRLLGSDDLSTGDLARLRMVASSGSALPGPVAEEWLRRVGPNLYNVYGSTEVGQATVATPEDLAVASGTAGRVIPGTTVKIFDDQGRPVPAGEDGRIFVASSAQFEEYTGGGTKEMIDGLMSSGDIGHFDDNERLFVTGRADDMIVSGGENVFPREVEDFLLTIAGVADAAVVGVDDDKFGQRLVAFVVLGDQSLVESTIRRLVGESLARHKVPREVVFIDELPRTETGKVLRHRLISPSADG